MPEGCPKHGNRSFITHRLRVWGDYACFTKPEFKGERVSYEAIPPSAARGILESILWKPEIAWTISRIHVQHPIVFDSIVRNEVGIKATARSRSIDIRDHRQQRHSLILRNVSYVIEASICLTESGMDEAVSRRISPGAMLNKYDQQFARRARAGQCFKTPCLGTREFMAFFELLGDDAPVRTCGINKDLGWLPLDLDWSQVPAKPILFPARMLDGVIEVPTTKPPKGVR